MTADLCKKTKKTKIEMFMYKISVLNNGLRVVSTYMPQATSASVYLFFANGSRFESYAENGISHFIEHMLFRGTERRPTSTILCGEIEGVGGFINGGTDKDFTEYYAIVPADRFSLAVDVLSDMILRSQFAIDDIEKERKVISEEIAMCFDNHQERCEVLIDSLLWPSHALGRSVIGTPRRINSFTAAQLSAYQKSHYGAHNAVLSVAGPLRHNEVVKQAKELFSALSSPLPFPMTPFRNRQSKSWVYEKRDIEQVHLTIAWPSISRSDPRRHHMDMANTLLSRGSSGRLFSEIRDKLGLAYSVESYQMRHHENGALAVYAATHKSQVEQTILAIIHEVKKLAYEKIDEAELAKARELIRGRLLLKAESTRSIAADTGSQLLLNNEILSSQQILDVVEKISTQDIQQSALWLISHQPKLAAVGSLDDLPKLERLLSHY